MGAVKLIDPVLLIVAAFSRQERALDWARRRLEENFGPRANPRLVYDFNHTRYYEQTMGAGLRKEFVVFRDLVCADRLADIKGLTNHLEDEAAHGGQFDEPRPLNLDPGVLTLGKFMLATTKDQAHRIYLRDGIFAEVTLRFEAGSYHPWPWTYADYREQAVLEFMKEARDYYRQCLGASAAHSGPAALHGEESA
jgi:hypothetical protein